MNVQRKWHGNSRSAASKGAELAKKRFSISSRVIPGLIIALDSLVVLSTALISYLAIINLAEPSYYAAAVAFVWLVSVMLMSFAGLYEFDAVTHPLKVADKIVIVFVTTFSFLLAAAFALKISSEYSRVWTGTFALSACSGTLIARTFAAQTIKHLAARH